MDFTAGFRNNFSSNKHYNYFTGSGFNLRQDLCSLSANSSGNDFGHSKYQNKLPLASFENEERKRAVSCPLPIPKKGFHPTLDLSPVEFPDEDLIEFPDDKLAGFKGLDQIPEETLHILVTGPPRCGKALLVESLAERKLRIAKDGGPSLAFNQSFTLLGMKVHAAVWYMQNPRNCTVSLKDAFSDKNFAIILVYDVTVRKTLLDVREYILAFKRVFGIGVPIILVGNKTDMRTLILNELSMLDWGFLEYCDGQRVKAEYKLADFIEGSAETGCGVKGLLFRASTVALAGLKF